LTILLYLNSEKKVVFFLKLQFLVDQHIVDDGKKNSLICWKIFISGWPRLQWNSTSKGKSNKQFPTWF